jgi:1-acyl-sn-glycerol-3-phosphate acyltransferase
MIIKARHHWFIYPFFKFYATYKIWGHFNSVTISDGFTDKGLPLLLICNHVSWWDGFWVMYANLKVFHRKFHFMMLEEQLRKYKFFINTGGYSVKKGSRSVIESINYTIELLTDSKNLVMLFPQGKITSIYDQSFHFERGIERILKAVNGKVQIVFLANLVDYFSNEKPSLSIYLQEWNSSYTCIEKIQEDFNRFFQGCVASNISKAES